MLIPFNRLSPMGNRGMHEKHQVTEEPCEGKLSSTVLKARQGGDSLTLANKTKVERPHVKKFVVALAIS